MPNSRIEIKLGQPWKGQIMKKLHLVPNEQNITQTFCSDAIGRNSDVICFCNLISTCEECFSIALDGKWGSGKTFFIKQVKLLLDYLNEHTKINEDCSNKLDVYFSSNPTFGEILSSSPSHATIYYDAWENDNDVDPILSLIYVAISTCQSELDVAKMRNFRDIAGSIATLLTGRNVTSFLNNLQGENPLKQLKNDKSVAKLMNDFIENLIVEHGDRLVIFIDELDRCNPNFAVKLLERIKHFLTDDRVTFVFSVNIEQLQHTIKKYYGADFCASRYLEKFFDKRVPLLNANYSKYYQSIGFVKSNCIYDQMCNLVITHFDFQIREKIKFLHETRTVVDTSVFIRFSFHEENAESFCLIYIVPIILGLQIYDITLYTNCIEGRNYFEFTEILIKYQDSFSEILWLLSKGETFSNEKAINTNIKLINLKERLIEVYNALFVNQYNRRNPKTLIGEMEFNAETKKKLLEFSSIFSPYSILNL